MRRLRNRFRELLAIKSRKENRTISQREVAEATGLAKTTVDRYGRNEITLYDERVVLTLCDYLGCDVSELLVIEEIQEGQLETPLAVPA